MTDDQTTTTNLLHQIDKLKHDRIDLVNQVEAEEEYITNVLAKRLEQLQREKVDLEAALEQEQEYMVNRLQKEMQAMARGTAGGVGVEALRRELDRQRVRYAEREHDRTIV